MRFETFGPIPPGAPLSRRVHERFFRALEREARRQAAGPLEEGAGGVTSRPPEVADLLLSGSAPAYIGQFVQARPGGLWQSIGSTFATPVYVRNNIAGLAGKVVRATRDQAGVYRATYPRIPGGHLSITGLVDTCCFTVSGTLFASVPLPGATVELWSGPTLVATATTVASGTTTGRYTFAGLSAGTYTVKLSYPNYAPFSQSVTISTSNGGVNICLTPDAAHVGGVAGYYTGVPKALSLTTPLGTVGLTFDAAHSAGGIYFWYGCQVGTTTWTAADVGGNCVVTHGGYGQATAIYYVLSATCSTVGTGAAAWELSATPSAWCADTSGGSLAYGVLGSADPACNPGLDSATMPLAPNVTRFDCFTSPAPGSPFALTLAWYGSTRFDVMLWDLATPTTPSPTLALSG